MNDLHARAKIRINLTTWLHGRRQTQEYMLCYSVYINTNTGKAILFLEVLQQLPWMSAE